MNSDFITALMEKINTFYNGYYEKVPPNVQFPYVVVPTITGSDLRYGEQCLVDIEIYNTDNTGVDSDDISEVLKEGLDGFRYCNSAGGFYMNYDSRLLNKFTDQDLVYRRITFIARIF